MITGILVLISAVALSVLAGYISIIGMTALFPGGGIQIIAMMATLEVSKIFVTMWIHRHWDNKLVNFAHRAYLIFAVLSLMVLTSIGIFGYLSRSHLDQEAPIAGIEIQLEQVQQKIEQIKVERKNLDDRKSQLDQALTTVLKNSKKASDAKTAQKIVDSQRKDRDQLTAAMTAKDTTINELYSEEAKLKLQSSDVAAKLGPIKYLATTFGISNPNFAVEAVIVLITLVFDPLAILLFLAGIISFEGENPSASPTPSHYPAPPNPPTEEPPLPTEEAARKLPTSTEAEIITTTEPEPISGPRSFGFSIASPHPIMPIVEPVRPPTAPSLPVEALPAPTIIDPLLGPPAAQSVKEQLVELLEHNPILLQSIIDTVIETKDKAPTVSTAVGEIVIPSLENYPPNAPNSGMKPQLAEPAGQWLTKPWF